jgi:hypothetical protein
MHSPFGFLLTSDESSAIGGVVVEQMESVPAYEPSRKRKYVQHVDEWPREKLLKMFGKKREEIEKRWAEKKARRQAYVSSNGETAASGGSSAATAASPSPSQPTVVATSSAPPIPNCEKTTTTEAKNTTTADAAVVVASSSVVGAHVASSPAMRAI